MKEKTFVIASGRLSLKILYDNSGAELSAFGKNANVDGDYRTPVFRLTLRDSESREEIEMTSAEGWDAVSAERHGEEGIITLRSGDCGLTVMLTARCAEENDAVEFTAEFLNESARYGVVSLEYPNLYYQVDVDTCLFHPHGSGALLRELAGKEADPRDQYPASAAGMQFMAVTDESTGESVYYGVHDPDASYKIFSYAKEKDSPVLRLYAVFFCENAGIPGNSQMLPGRLAVRAFKGDWYDAAMIYSAFVEAEASWLSPVKNGLRIDVPEWMQNTANWWLCSVGDDESYVENLLKAQKELGCTSSLHLYVWHEIPFDNDYPHYFPAKKCFLDSFKRLQEAGIRVMPYINGRLWDTRDMKTRDYQFSTVARKGATKDTAGEPVTEFYGSKEEDGSPVKLAVMCPSSPVWVNKQKEVIDRLLNEVGVDAVYVDQIASAPPVLCYDETHGHPVGGGRWWVKEYHRLLEQVRKAVPAGSALTTESTAEPFVDMFQGYLSWDSVFDGQVPAFTAVYGRHMIAFGRCYNMADEDVLFAVAAQSLLWGEQLGWINPNRYLNLKNRGFYNAIVKTREALKDYLLYGRLLRPPYVKSGAKKIEGETMKGAFKSEAVLSGLWQKGTGTEKVLIAVNLSHAEETCEILSEHILCAPRFNMPLDASFENGKLTLKLTAQTVVYAKLD